MVGRWWAGRDLQRRRPCTMVGVHRMQAERQKDVGSTALAVAVDANALEAGTAEEGPPWCYKYVSDEDE